MVDFVAATAVTASLISIFTQNPNAETLIEGGILKTVAGIFTGNPLLIIGSAIGMIGGLVFILDGGVIRSVDLTLGNFRVIPMKDPVPRFDTENKFNQY